MKLKNLCRAAAGIAAAFGMSVMSAVSYYSGSLPDSFTLAKNQRLSVNTVFEITSDITADEVTALNGGSENLQTRTLKLFNTIPIKNVSTKSVERPVLVTGGQAFGIRLVTDGVMVVDLENLGTGCPAAACGITVGDIITSVDGKEVTSNKRISEIISASCGKPCTINYTHKGQEKSATLTPVFSGGSYKAGLWVRDSSAGIGTVTFYNPETGEFAGLGHAVCDNDTKEPLPLSHGSVAEVKITGYTKSEKGEPGQLLGEFASSASVGTLTQNNENGVFGTLNFAPSGKLLELGFAQEVHTGKASIYTSLDGGEPQEYEISIEETDISEDAEHDMIIKITDEELIEKTGGIVQGMSGSPIIQDGRIVGAVTHVFVDNPTYGYGIFAEEMYSQFTEM